MTGQMIGRKGPPRAVIFGCEGPSLSDAEKRFFEDANPLGFILFARNIDTPDQVRALVRDLRATELEIFHAVLSWAEAQSSPDALPEVLAEDARATFERLGPATARRVLRAALAKERGLRH